VPEQTRFRVDRGRGAWANIAQADALPGGMAKVWLKSNKDNRPFEFRGEVVDYETRSR
jgi:hypothetical protein